MRISELSDLSGVSAASIKYYTREGLLPAGERTGYNSTDYTDAHVDRLRLIRALIDTGGLSVNATREVLAAIDDPELPLDEVLGTAQQAVPHTDAPPTEATLGALRTLMRAQGWATLPENPGIPVAAAALREFQALAPDELDDWLGAYARAADIIAEADVDFVLSVEARGRVAERVVVGTALGDVLLAGLRRIAQESLTHRRFRGGVVPSDRPEPQ